MPKLQAAELRVALKTVPAWRKEGAALVRTFQFPDFAAAMKFVNAVARAAERADHHPDLTIRWNKVTLTLNTHSAGGLTKRDFALAKQCDGLA